MKVDNSCVMAECREAVLGAYLHDARFPEANQEDNKYKWIAARETEMKMQPLLL